MMGLMEYQIHPALLWKPEGEDARCGLCERRCLVAHGKTGFCKARRNAGGTSPPAGAGGVPKFAGVPANFANLVTLTYGNLSSVESRPIEIKPFYHYWPGSSALTFATFSCNLSCHWCQNDSISRSLPPAENEFTSPEQLVAMAKEAGDDGLCASFQEPTLLLEYCLDLFKLAKKQGLYCCFVSNGYMTSEALELLEEAGLDGLKIDIKGGPEVYREYCGKVDGSIPWKRAEEARELGIHVEIVNLLVTDLNDDADSVKALVEHHLEILGQDVPLHFTRYHPAHKFTRPPTPGIRLERARELAFSAGVRFPYLGNMHGHKYENTYCPECGKLLILRQGPRVLDVRLTESSACPNCGEDIPITGTAKVTHIPW